MSHVKHKGGKRPTEGGLGGRTGRGGHRSSIRAKDETATPYRQAMTELSQKAIRGRKSKKMMALEKRQAIVAAKDRLREEFGIPQNTKGKGAPGARYGKPKVKSRRNPARASKPRA